jgi:ElaB/YqjD/DUF883 family membrane-anchored ribosome-binding protein
MSAEESEEELNIMFSKLDKEVNKLNSRLQRNESKARKRISNLVEMAELMIESYRLEYCRKDDTLIAKSKKFHQTLDQTKSSIEKIINKYFSDLRQEEEEARKNAHEMVGVELIQLGDQMQDDGIERLLQMNKDMDLNQEKVTDINQNLLEQNGKLMNAELEVKEIESTLKRAKKYILYFSKEYYYDTFIRIMVTLIFVCLIAICVTIYFKKKG